MVAEDPSAEGAVVHEGVPYVVTEEPGGFLPQPEDLYWDDIDPAVAERVGHGRALWPGARRQACAIHSGGKPPHSTWVEWLG